MNLSKFEFRFAELQDSDPLAELMLEANRHYWGESDGAAEMTSKAAHALVNGQSGCRAVVACDAGVLKGFATVSVLHPALNESGTLFMASLGSSPLPCTATGPERSAKFGTCAESMRCAPQSVNLPPE